MRLLQHLTSVLGHSSTSRCGSSSPGCRAPITNHVCCCNTTSSGPSSSASPAHWSTSESLPSECSNLSCALVPTLTFFTIARSAATKYRIWWTSNRRATWCSRREDRSRGPTPRSSDSAASAADGSEPGANSTVGPATCESESRHSANSCPES